MPQLPYTLDFSSADFFLFPKLKAPMKGKRCVAFEEIKEKSKQELLVIPKTAFQKCYENWKNAGIRIIYLRGVTLKGTNKIVIDKLMKTFSKKI